MDKLHREILGFVLVMCTLLSSYLTLIQIVNTFKPDGLLKSLTVKSLRGMNLTRQFVMGDTLEFEAESEYADSYGLRVYQNSSLVYKATERVCSSCFKAHLSVNPPVFNAGQVYVAFVDVYSHNDPIPGAYFSDRGRCMFEVLAAETHMELDCCYNGSLHNLHLTASLTDADGYPVINETVAFSLQFSHRHRLTDGWLPFGSVSTNASGAAELSLALNVSAGNYSARAVHVGNGNFGESAKSVDFEVSGSETIAGPGLESQSSSPLSELGTLSIWVGTPHVPDPYAELEINVTAEYHTSIFIDPLAPIDVVFYYDLISPSTFLGYADLRFTGGTPPDCFYRGLLGWSPQLIGSNPLIGRVVNNTDHTVLAEQTIPLYIRPCPSNLAIHVPEATYNSSLPLAVAFAEPRLYEEATEGSYSSYSLAPKFTYNGLMYAVDCPVGSVVIQLLVNGTFESANVTNDSGVAFFKPCLDLGQQFGVRLEAGAVWPPFYDASDTVRDVRLTRVNVSDTVVGKDNMFRINCNVGNSVQGEESVYVEADKPIEVNTELFGLPIQDASVSLLVGKPIVSAEKRWSEESEWVSIRNGSGLIRVLALCGAGQALGAAADVLKDDRVDIQDLARVQGAFGSYPTHAKWYWRADINLDLKVDIKDLTIASSKFGSHGFGYLRLADYSAVRAAFYEGPRYVGQVNLTCSGCVAVPDDADRLFLHYGGVRWGCVLEFYRNATLQDCQTNNAGTAEVVWRPEEIASPISYPDGFPVYVAVAWMPSSLQILVSRFVSDFEVRDELCSVQFIEVLRRPISLSVECTPENATLDDTVTVSVDCFDAGLGAPASGSYVYFYICGKICTSGEIIYIYLGWAEANSSGVAVFSFVPRPYIEELCLLKYFYVVAVCFETDWTAYCEIAVPLDVRYRTRLEFLGEETIYAPVSPQGVKLECRLVRADNGAPVLNRTVHVYMNDSWQGCGYTWPDGIMNFSVTISVAGLYFFRLRFFWGEGLDDGDYQNSNNVTFVIVADVRPVFVFFEVTPKDFRPGTVITLKATVYNASLANQTLSGFDIWFYRRDCYGAVQVVGHDVTDAYGVAEVTWTYPASGTYIFWAIVSAAQQVISSPVMLTVGYETRLTLDILPDSDFNHTVSGKLVSNGAPVPNRPIIIKVNGTVIGNTTTSADGSYGGILYLPAVNNAPTNYQVEAVYYGDNALNLTGYTYLPNGTLCALCTTLQYFSCKPAANCTRVTVEPQTAHALTADKTPEQLQQEANSTGWLTIWHEFSWWYPWYRMHVQVKANPTIHLALNPVLPGGELAKWDGMEFFGNLTGEAIETMATEFLGLVGTYVLAKFFSITSLAAGIVVEFGKILAQGYLFLRDWDSVEAMMAAGLMSTVMLLFTITEFSSTVSNFVTLMIDELRSICGWPLINSLTWILTKLKDMVLWGRGALSSVVDVMEILADFTTMVLSLRRCFELLGIQ